MEGKFGPKFFFNLKCILLSYFIYSLSGFFKYYIKNDNVILTIYIDK